MLFHCFLHKKEPTTNRNALLEKRISDLEVLIYDECMCKGHMVSFNRCKDKDFS